MITWGGRRGAQTQTLNVITRRQGLATAVAVLTLREAVAAWLRSQSSVASIVGNRIYFGQPSQRASYPCLAFKISSRSYGHNLAGADGTSIATITFIALGNAQSQTVAVAEAIRNFADGFRGLQNGVAILSCLLDDESDDEYQPPDGSDVWIYQTSLDYVVKHRVPSPSSVTQTNC
jgi:hypothetical protein